VHAVVFLRTRRPHSSTLFPYTTLFRSVVVDFVIVPGDKPRALRMHAVQQRIGAVLRVPDAVIAQRLDLLARVASQSSVASAVLRSEEHTSELQSRENLVCRLLLENKKV